MIIRRNIPYDVSCVKKSARLMRVSRSQDRCGSQSVVSEAHSRAAFAYFLTSVLPALAGHAQDDERDQQH